MLYCNPPDKFLGASINLCLVTCILTAMVLYRKVSRSLLTSTSCLGHLAQDYQIDQKVSKGNCNVVSLFINILYRLVAEIHSKAQTHQLIINYHILSSFPGAFLGSQSERMQINC